MTRVYPILIALVVTTGCSKQDTDGLNEVGRRIAARFGSAAGGPEGALAQGWKAAHATVDKDRLQDRVLLRMRWDQYLAEAPIQVRLVEPGVIELGGPVEKVELQRRALDLATSTQGVKKVVEKWTTLASLGSKK